VGQPAIPWWVDPVPDPADKTLSAGAAAIILRTLLVSVITGLTGARQDIAGQVPSAIADFRFQIAD
jgi:hypothetical protein